MSPVIKSENYHDYVIAEGAFVGEFEQMYQNCPNPWPETEADLEALPTSSRTPELIAGAGKVFSLGCGKGMHLNWLSKKNPNSKFSGCDIAPSAVQACNEAYPHLDVWEMDVEGFMQANVEFDVILVREVVWYFLDKWDAFCESLKKYKGRHILVELSFYDNQKYGTEVFDGPDVFVKKFPFEIKEIVRWHVTAKQREGMLLLYAQI